MDPELAGFLRLQKIKLSFYASVSEVSFPNSPFTPQTILSAHTSNCLGLASNSIIKNQKEPHNRREREKKEKIMIAHVKDIYANGLSDLYP